MLTELHNKPKEIIIALDTNMIMAVSQFKVDVVQQINSWNPNAKILVPEQVIAELKKLEKDGNRNIKKHSTIGLKLLASNNVEVVKTQAENADLALQELALNGIIIATNDKILRKKIKDTGRIIFLRKKKYLEFDQKE